VQQLSQLISSHRLTVYETEVPEILWQDELGRLRIWAKEAQLPSLDVRLHDAIHIHEQVIRILLRLQRALGDMQDVLGDTSEEAMSDADTDDDDVDGTEMQMIYHSLRDTVNCLFHITTTILQPAYHPLVSAKVAGLSRSVLVQGAFSQESTPVERSAAIGEIPTAEPTPVGHEDPEEAPTATLMEQTARGIGGVDAIEVSLPAIVPAAAGAKLAQQRKKQSLGQSKSSPEGIRRSGSLPDRWTKSLEEAKRQEEGLIWDRIRKSDSVIRPVIGNYATNSINPKRMTSVYEPHSLGDLNRSVADVDGQIREAVKLLKHVVTVRKSTLGKEHPDRLASQHALALAYEANGQIKEAVKLLEHVVTVRERMLAEEHPDRLASQLALAAEYKANGQIMEAVKLLEHVVTVQERTLAEEHPDRLASQHKLASAYQANGQIKQAVELLKHVVTVQERTLAEEHPDRLESQRALTRLL
jgi:tetratricopeptide (TPR) repeat protein